MSEIQKKILIRQADVFAAYTAYNDHEIGRVIQAVEDMGKLDNTLIIYINGDNGTSSEGTMMGTPNWMAAANGVLELPELEYLRFYESWGSDQTYPHMAVPWAWAFDTPFKWVKQVASHFGGTRQGMAISWPGHIDDVGGIRTQFHHFIDIVPTILEAAGIPAPQEVDGIKQKPIEGVSMAYTFDDADAPGRRTTQYFEMLGNQGIYHDGWMASALRGVPWLSTNEPGDLLNMPWELYHVDADFSQAVDLAKQQPEKLQELVKLFFAEAARYDVLPLDDRKTERLDVANRPSLTEGRTRFDYPRGLRLPEGAAPDLKHRDHTISAKVTVPQGGAEGVLVALGGRFAGFALYLDAGRLVYHYNLAGVERYTIASDEPIPPGEVELRAVYRTDADRPFAGGTVTLYAGDRQVGQGRVEKSIPNRVTLDETLDIGFDTGTPVAEGYELPFRFNGRLEAVTIELGR
jgi:arylsulfatase